MWCHAQAEGAGMCPYTQNMAALRLPNVPARAAESRVAGVDHCEGRGFARLNPFARLAEDGTRPDQSFSFTACGCGIDREMIGVLRLSSVITLHVLCLSRPRDAGE